MVVPSAQIALVATVGFYTAYRLLRDEMGFSLACLLGGCFGGSNTTQAILRCSNDFEFVIRASKLLEHVLEESFGAQGKGLHEKVESVENRLPRDIVREMHYLATIRNKVVHEQGFDRIPDRAAFNRKFIHAEGELRRIVAQRSGGRPSGTCSVQ